MLQNLTGWHALIILAIVVLIFGAAKLPALAKSVGQSMRILKSEVAETPSAARIAPTPSAGSPADARDSADIVRPALRAAE
jgi:sec-independent protein translocase protein TatA